MCQTSGVRQAVERRHADTMLSGRAAPAACSACRRNTRGHAESYWLLATSFTSNAASATRVPANLFIGAIFPKISLNLDRLACGCWRGATG
jgi:hypothetical protein